MPLIDHKGQEVPSGPMHLSRASWLAAARRTVHEFGEDVLTDRAAALTYYAVLSIFPALLVLVSLLGLIGKSATQPMITNLSQAAPGAVRQIILQAINNLQKGHTTAGALAVVSLAGALWSASSYVAAFRRASNVIYDVPEGRPIWKTAPLRIGVTLSVMVMLVISALIVVVTGGLARHVGQVLGIGSVTMRVWGIAKWPALVSIVSVMFALLYWVSPMPSEDSAGWPRAGFSRWRHGSSRPACSPFMLRTSATTTRPTAASPHWSYFSCGYGSPTSRSCLARNSTRNSNAAARPRQVSRLAQNPSSNHATSERCGNGSERGQEHHNVITGVVSVWACRGPASRPAPGPAALPAQRG